MKRVVVGVGNDLRRDDGFGLAVAARLRGRVPAGVEIAECEQELSRLLDTWDGASTAIVVDAVESGSTPGTLHRYDAGAEADAIPARMFRSSTHAFGVGEAIEVARALGRLPRQVVVYGVEGSEFTAGEGLTTSVEAAVEIVATAVLDDLDRLAREDEPCTSER